jgi:DNA-binding response OmpR family regulator
MLTSRTGDKHRQLAMTLGAAAYFSKPYNERELLSTTEAINYRKPSKKAHSFRCGMSGFHRNIALSFNLVQTRIFRL